MYKKILIANNGSDGSFTALVEALRLSRANGSEAHMIYVEENIPRNAPEAWQ
jgi:nucleotide-binding universal stress UspA family protein